MKLRGYIKYHYFGRSRITLGLEDSSTLVGRGKMKEENKSDNYTRPEVRKSEQRMGWE